MKGLVVVFVLFIALGVSFGVAGAVVPEKNEVVVGLKSGLVTERKIRNTSLSETYELESSKYLVNLGYGVTDWLSVWADLGGATDTEVVLPDGSNYEFEDNFAWGLGVNVRLFESSDKSFSVLAGAKYFSVNELKAEGGSALMSGDSLKLKWQDWRFCLSAAKKVGRLTPYAGLTYALFKHDITSYISEDAVTKNYDVKQKEEVGLLIGIDLGVTDNLTMNVEGNFVNEEAVTIGVTYKF